VLLVSSRAQGTEEIRTFLQGSTAPHFADPALRGALAGMGLASHGGRTLMALGASEFEWFVR
jgi:hypothetical protein